MNADDINEAEALIADSPDYEDCERFASRYGQALIEIARSHSTLLAALKLAHALMDNQEGASNPLDSVCGQLPAGGLRCEELADEVLDILSKVIALSGIQTPPGFDQWGRT